MTMNGLPPRPDSCPPGGREGGGPGLIPGPVGLSAGALKASNSTHGGNLSSKAPSVTSTSNRSIVGEAFGYEHLLVPLTDPGAKIIQLDLSNRDIKPDACIDLSDSLRRNKSLLNLNLNRTGLGRDGVWNLSDVFKYNLCTVTSLDLVGNNLGKDGARAIADFLKDNTTLKQINLSENNMGKEGTRWLEDALKVNKSLESLNLRSNSLGKEGAKACSSIFEVNKGLTSLNLVNNGFGVAGGEILRDAMQNNKKIVNLNLVWNGIGEEILEEIGEKLKENKNLQDELAGVEDSDSVVTVEKMIERLMLLEQTRKSFSWKMDADLLGELLQRELDTTETFGEKLMDVEEFFCDEANEGTEELRQDLEMLEAQVSQASAAGRKPRPQSARPPQKDVEVSVPLQPELRREVSFQSQDSVSLGTGWGMTQPKLTDLAQLTSQRDQLRLNYCETLTLRLRRLKELDGLKDERRGYLDEAIASLEGAQVKLAQAVEKTQRAPPISRQSSMKDAGDAEAEGGAGKKDGKDSTKDGGGVGGARSNPTVVTINASGAATNPADVDPAEAERKARRRMDTKRLCPKYHVWNDKVADGPQKTKLKFTDRAVRELYSICESEIRQWDSLWSEGRTLSHNLVQASTYVLERLKAEEPDRVLGHLAPYAAVHEKQLSQIHSVVNEQKEVRHLVRYHNEVLDQWKAINKEIIVLDSQVKMLQLEAPDDDDEVVVLKDELESKHEEVAQLTSQKDAMCKRLAILSSKGHPELLHSNHATGCLSCQMYKGVSGNTIAEGNEEE
eukprot:GFYU01012750.1.p1 GENE.GFYU01012750.1~~GFYU01012750.1.p1  ORF type:complete len:785 (-),score=200.38 GFYU01012750.1:111-2465(-)